MPKFQTGARAFVNAALAIASASQLGAQQAPRFPNPPITFDGKGISVYSTDSISRLTFRFRVQELLSGTTESESDLGFESTQLLIRRMRLRMDGVVLDPRLSVNVQLSFARPDLDQENSGIANVLRDAMVTWQFTERFAASFGQGKLPGNRQRQVSSSELQSPDRSPVNSLLTVDRDVGIFTAYSADVGTAQLIARAALTAGEGRGPATNDDGLAYTGRMEFLPFGAFTDGGDYVEGDLAREPERRLALAVAVSHNDRARRVGGQLGPLLFGQRSMTTYFADAIYKHRGLAVQVEYARRVAPDPVTNAGDSARYVFTGEGVNVQASWLPARWNIEPVVRFTRVTPGIAIRAQRDAEALQEASLGFSRYFNGHRIKMNGDVIHVRRTNLLNDEHRAAWTMRLGVELGI